MELNAIISAALTELPFRPHLELVCRFLDCEPSDTQEGTLTILEKHLANALDPLLFDCRTFLAHLSFSGKKPKVSYWNTPMPGTVPSDKVLQFVVNQFQGSTKGSLLREALKEMRESIIKTALPSKALRRQWSLIRRNVDRDNWFRISKNHTDKFMREFTDFLKEHYWCRIDSDDTKLLKTLLCDKTKKEITLRNYVALFESVPLQERWFQEIKKQINK